MTFLVNLMFSRLDKFDGPIIEEAYIQGGGAYIREVNWITYLGDIYSGCLYMRGGVGVLAGFYGFLHFFHLLVI